MIQAYREFKSLVLKINNAVSQYTDDTTLILTNDYSITRTFNLISIFELGSGSRLNPKKTEGWIGSRVGCTSRPVNITWVADKLKIFCVYVGNTNLDQAIWAELFTSPILRRRRHVEGVALPAMWQISVQRCNALIMKRQVTELVIAKNYNCVKFVTMRRTQWPNVCIFFTALMWSLRPLRTYLMGLLQRSHVGKTKAQRKQRKRKQRKKKRQR